MVVAVGGRTPCLFLSHSGIDSEAAKALKRAILAVPAAAEAGLEVWLDKDDLVPGVAGWQEQIEKALTRRATAFAVLVGSRGVVNWVEREVRIGLSLATGPEAIPFVPVLAKDAPGPEALPPFAQQHQCVADPLGDPAQLSLLVAAALGRGGRPPPVLEEPFVGLRSMSEQDAGRFFGRGAEVADLVAALGRHRLLAIVADSGAGKSSLAMAGLVPAFRGGAFADPAGRGPERRIWHALVMRPGADPLEGLRRGVTEAAERMGLAPEARAGLRKRIDLADPAESAWALRCDLPAGETETLLVVDQFDELLTETPEAARTPFVDFLTALAAMPEPGGFRVVLTVRADYFNLCRPFGALYRRLADAEHPATLRLKRISDAGLDEAVRRPLELAGYDRGDDAERLARQTVRDLSDRAGDLALAQMALYVVWHRRRRPDGTLLGAYADVGGVAGALAQEAERIRTETVPEGAGVPGRLTAAEAALLVPLFVRLVRLGETGGALRRIALRDELDPARLALAERLCSKEFSRLLLAGDGTFEVCHEALITQWPWLQDELNRAAADLRDLDPLMRKAALWAAAADKAKAGHLATGVEREAFSALAGRREDWLSAAEREFVAASDGAFAAETAARRRAQRFRHWTTRVAAIAALMFAAMALWAGWQTLEARRLADLAEIRLAGVETKTREAQFNETVSFVALAKLALAEGSPTESVKLALAAWPRSGDADRPSLRRVIALLSDALPELRERVRLVDYYGGIVSAAISRDDSRLLILSQDGKARIWDAVTGQKVATIQEPEGEIAEAIFSPEGLRVATVSPDGTARLWEALTGQEISALQKNKGHSTSVAFSPDGTRVVTTSDGNTARIWNATSGVLIVVLEGHESEVAGAAFSPDGLHVLTFSRDQTARIWDATTGDQIALIKERLEVIGKAIFSPSGTHIITIVGNRLDIFFGGPLTVRLWNRSLNGWTETFSIFGNFASALFSPNGKLVVTTSIDGRTRFWDAATGSEVKIVQGNVGQIRNAEFSPNEAQILSTDLNDQTVLLWDAVTGIQISKLDVLNTIEQAAFSPSGEKVMTISREGSVRLWNARVSTPLGMPMRHSSELKDIAFAPDGTRILTTSYDGKARVWDTESGVLTTQKILSRSRNFSAKFSLDGMRIVTIGENIAELWDRETGSKIVQLRGHKGWISAVDFSTDGQRILTISNDWNDKTARLWNGSTGALLGLMHHSAPIYAAGFAPDGKRILTVSGAGTGYLWDGTTGAEIATFEHSAKGASFSPDATHIVTFSDDGTARLWNATSGLPMGETIRHNGPISSAAFSADGSRLVTASQDGTARIWDASTGHNLTAPMWHEKGVGHAEFLTGGARVMTYSDYIMRVWDAYTNLSLFGIFALSPLYSTDGTRIVISQLNSAAILDAATGIAIDIIQGPVNNIALSPDGTRIVTASSDGTARVWDISSLEKGDAFQIACQRLGNNTSLKDVQERYGLGELTPICGDNPPLPVDWSKLQ